MAERRVIQIMRMQTGSKIVAFGASYTANIITCINNVCMYIMSRWRKERESVTSVE